MGKLAFLDGSFVGQASAKISTVSNAALYGRGVFTTVRIIAGQAFLLEKHLRRLKKNADTVGLDTADGVMDRLGSNLRELVDANKVVRGRARITLFDRTVSSLWTSPPESAVNVLIVTGEERPAPDRFRLTISPHPLNSKSPLRGVKSCNYLENLMAFSGAKDRGFDEAILLNERGEVTSGAMSNVFWLTDGELFTPRLETGCLGGTMREYILERLTCSEVYARVEEIQNADSIFLTSAGIGVRRVAALNDRQFEPVDHAILHLIPE